MYRTGIALIAVAWIAFSAGCRMCAHPYDYCGPVDTGCADNCCPNGPRAGSLFAMGAATPSGGEIDYRMEATPSILESDTEAAPAEPSTEESIPPPSLSEPISDLDEPSAEEDGPRLTSAVETPGWTARRVVRP